MPPFEGSSDEIRATVRSFLIETFLFGDEAAAPSDSDDLVQSGTIDSTGILELMGYLEDTFEFEIDDEEAIPANLGTVDHITAFVGRKLAQGDRSTT